MMMNIPGNPTSFRTAPPSFEDAIRAGHARRKLAVRLGTPQPTILSFFARANVDSISLPPAAVAALHGILAAMSTGRSVVVTIEEHEIEIDEAGPLVGVDPLDLLEALQRLDLPYQGEGPQVYVSTRTIAQCAAAVEGDCPAELAAPAAQATDWTLAKSILLSRPRDFVRNLVGGLLRIGKTGFEDVDVLDWYFGRRPLPGKRPPSWPDLPRERRRPVRVWSPSGPAAD
jgi:hypothetical protein